MQTPRSSLEQWRVLQAVIDYGGFAKAAEQLHRSQSSVSYSVAKLQQQLGVELLVMKGRKACLTQKGETLLRRSRELLNEAISLENLANSMEQGWEPDISLVVDAAFPVHLLMEALKHFTPHSRGTRVQLNEVILSGAEQALEEGWADLVIGVHVPKGYLGDLIVEIEFVAVASPEHPLHQLGRGLRSDDLRQQVQVVIGDSGNVRPMEWGWLGEQRWTVSSIDKAVTTVCHGLGFSWLPRHQIETELVEGRLKPLPLSEGQCFKADLYQVFGHPERIGPATRKLAEILMEVSHQQ
ncbi:MAG: LysR family transcriptional regulator [Gammaproteobacteria bacterium]|nr:LysR family transcriptional regulator [Gammaproteobacteria bacterium]